MPPWRDGERGKTGHTGWNVGEEGVQCLEYEKGRSNIEEGEEVRGGDLVAFSSVSFLSLQ